MEHVFGPVQSRRLGRSLGVDPIPLKTCNWNCVYCQLGRTRPLTNRRRIYAPTELILEEVRGALANRSRGGIDYVSFVGSGEPTLHADIGRLVRDVKALTDVPVAVITNGSFLYLPDVRDALVAADAVLPTLDAGSAGLYRRINRPHPEASFDRLVDGLTAFRRQYHGKLWLEVMLVSGLNDSAQALCELAHVLRDIRPDEIHIMRPIRLPAEAWVTPGDDAAAARALAILSCAAPVSMQASVGFEGATREVVAEAVVGILARHPAQESDLKRWLARSAPGQEDTVLGTLESSGRVQIIERGDTRYWSVPGACYAS